MRVSEGSQVQWHACISITSGQERVPQSRTGSSRKRLAFITTINQGIMDKLMVKEKYLLSAITGKILQGFYTVVGDFG